WETRARKAGARKKIVPPRLNQMRHRLIKPDLRCDPIRMPRRQSEPQVFIPSFAGAEQHKRRVQSRELVGDLGNQVEAFLIDEPGDETNERPLSRGAVNRKPEPL